MSGCPHQVVTRHRLLLALLALLAWHRGFAATDDCQSLTDITPQDLETFEFESDTSSWASLPEQQSYRLGRIEVVRQNVFERENNWLQTFANRYHHRTREKVILSALPVTTGDRVNQRSLAEAERILRHKIYLYDARVIPRRLCGEVLDIYVVTRDVWTLMPRIALGRTGGENNVGLGLNEANLLGNGQFVSVAYQKDKDRHGVAFAFSDANVDHSRWAVDLLAEQNNDGEHTAVSLRRPFYSLDAPRTYSLSVDDYRRNEGLYLLGDELWEYRAKSRSYRVFTGFSSGLARGWVDRLLVGYAYEDERFRLPAAFTSAFPSAGLPEREYAYPFVAFQRVQDDYETRVNLDRVQRTEDVALGAQLYAELGYSAGSAARGEYLVGRLTYADAAWLAPQHLIAFNAWLDGYYDLAHDVSENLEFGGRISYRFRQARSWSLLVEGSATAIRHPTLDRQLLLGGDTGLRGYPNRYQTGDRRFLVTVEERYYSNLYPWQMFRLGAAVFVDAGRAWYQDQAPNWLPADRSASYYDTLADAGIGLRLESTRTRGDQIIHVDLAFPLRGGPNVRDVELTLTAKQTL